MPTSRPCGDFSREQDNIPNPHRPRQFAAPPSTAADRPWFQRSLVGLEVGPTGSQFGGSTNDTSFAVRFNGRDIARATKDCGAEYLVIWAGEGDWAFYDSRLQPKPPGLGTRDVLREAVDEGRKLGLPVIVYCQVQYPGHTLRAHGTKTGSGCSSSVTPAARSSSRR